MNIYDLRKITHVKDYFSDNLGATITYVSTTQKENVIKLDIETLSKELEMIGSIDPEFPGELENYAMSQWDALNIAIRFELSREQEKEIDNSDIGKAIKNITNGQGDAY